MTKNRTDFSNMATGSTNARHSTDRKTVEVEPLKATGDIKEEKSLPDPKGVAKASPRFQEVKSDDEQTEEEKKQALASHTEKVDEEENDEDE